MQVFELYFNPEKRDDLFLANFIYTPANIYEEKLGSLCVLGELIRATPRNSHFLANLASIIKKEYYASGLTKSCEASLEKALKKGNEFLDQESRNGNVSWLGNLNFSVISLKDSVLNFAKVGDLKIFLVRANTLMDLGQNLETGLPHPDPLKVFGGMAGGKISDEDKIIVLNKGIWAALGKKQKFLGELARTSNEKGLRQVFKIHRESLVAFSGIGLVLMPNVKDDSKQTIILENKLSNFSFKVPKINVPKIKITRLKLPGLPKLPRVNVKIARKKIFLVVSLVLILLAFYYIFRGERVQELRDAQTKLTEARSKAALAESLLILKKDDQAQALFEETLDILSSLTKRGSPLRQEALSLQDSVKQYLK